MSSVPSLLNARTSPFDQPSPPPPSCRVSLSAYREILIRLLQLMFFLDSSVGVSE